MTATVAATSLISEADIRRVLDEIKDPCSIAASVPMGLSEMGLVKSVSFRGEGQVTVELRLTSPFCEMISYMRGEALTKIRELPGVKSVSVTHDSGLDWDHELISPEAQARRQQRLHRLRDMYAAHGGAQKIRD